MKIAGSGAGSVSQRGMDPQIRIRTKMQEIPNTSFRQYTCQMVLPLQQANDLTPRIPTDKRQRNPRSLLQGNAQI